MVDLFGVTRAGFIRKRQPDIQTELADGYVNSFGNVQTDAQSVNGQKIAIHSDQIGKNWEVLEQTYDDAYIDSASDAGLDRMGALVLRPRLAATQSVATLLLTGASGTLVPLGSIVSDGLIQWITIADATIGTNSLAEVDASPANTGAIVALAGTLTQIVTPVSGWASVTNELDAVPGRNIEGADSYRLRIKQAFRTANSSAAGSISAQLLALDGVTECLVIQNRSDFPDIDGRPPHSFEPVVRDGSDEDIVSQLYKQAGAGGVMVGDRVFEVTDSLGGVQIVKFSRPIERLIYLQVTYSVFSGFPLDGEAQILATILEYGTSFKLGQDVVPIQIVQQIEITKLRNLTVLAGFSPFALSSEPTEITDKELARFDSTRVTFVRVT